MFKPKREFITTSETILFVSSFFMWIYVTHTIVFIDSFDSLFFTNSWWLMLPITTFLLFLRSFVGRRVDLTFNWEDDEEDETKSNRKQD